MATTKHKPAPPRADIVTQRELQDILDRYNALGLDILQIRKRREAGAGVEPGKYTAESNPGDPIEHYGRPVHGIGMFGLDLEEKGKPSDVYVEDEPAPTKVEPQPEEDDEEEDLDWIDETPEIEYRLIADGTTVSGCGHWLQDIDVTCDEFIALKAQLATLRGYQVPQEALNA